MLTPQKVVIAIQNLIHVKGLVFLHLLLHQVFHDSRVKVLAGLLVRNVVLLRVVEESFAVLVFLKGGLLSLYTASSRSLLLASILAEVVIIAILFAAS